MKRQRCDRWTDLDVREREAQQLRRRREATVIGSQLQRLALAAQEIQAASPNVTFIHYACSGAKLAAADTPNDPSKPPAQDAINQLRIVRQRVPRIDALLITAGANSLHGKFGSGIGALVTRCLVGGTVGYFTSCAVDPQVGQDISNSLTNLKRPGGSFEQLAKVINCINPADGTPEASWRNCCEAPTSSSSLARYRMKHAT